LLDQRHAPPRARRGAAPQRLAVEQHGTLGRRFQQGKEPQERALASPFTIATRPRRGANAGRSSTTRVP
jgi:hypothetical protein